MIASGILKYSMFRTGGDKVKVERFVCRRCDGCECEGITREHVVCVKEIGRVCRDDEKAEGKR